MNTQRQSVAVLFADMKGFSGIKSDKVKSQAFAFIYNIVEKAKENNMFILSSQNTNIIGNTWGDAIFLADYSAVNLAKIALKIRDEARQTDWQYQLNIDKPIKFRIGLNFGEAEVMSKDGKIINVIGGTVDLGARIEPATEVDAVFCSDIFWHMIQGKANIKATPKTITLPKSAGTIQAHKLLWEYESDNNTTENTNTEEQQTKTKMSNNMSIDKVNDLIDLEKYAEVFEILEEYYEQMGSDKSTYNRLKKEHKKNAKSLDYEDRLKTFVNDLKKQLA